MAPLWTESMTVQDIKFNVHAHPTLSEVLDELFKQAHVEKMQRSDVKPSQPKGSAMKVAVAAWTESSSADSNKVPNIPTDVSSNESKHVQSHNAEQQRDVMDSGVNHSSTIIDASKIEPSSGHNDREENSNINEDCGEPCTSGTSENIEKVWDGANLSNQDTANESQSRRTHLQSEQKSPLSAQQHQTKVNTDENLHLTDSQSKESTYPGEELEFPSTVDKKIKDLTDMQKVSQFLQHEDQIDWRKKPSLSDRLGSLTSLWLVNLSQTGNEVLKLLKGRPDAAKDLSRFGIVLRPPSSLLVWGLFCIICCLLFLYSSWHCLLLNTRL